MYGRRQLAPSTDLDSTQAAFWDTLHDRLARFDRGGLEGEPAVLYDQLGELRRQLLASGSKQHRPYAHHLLFLMLNLRVTIGGSQPIPVDLGQVVDEIMAGDDVDIHPTDAVRLLYYLVRETHGFAEGPAQPFVDRAFAIANRAVPETMGFALMMRGRWAQQAGQTRLQVRLRAEDPLILGESESAEFLRTGARDYEAAADLVRPGDPKYGQRMLFPLGNASLCYVGAGDIDIALALCERAEAIAIEHREVIHHKDLLAQRAAILVIGSALRPERERKAWRDRAHQLCLEVASFARQKGIARDEYFALRIAVALEGWLSSHLEAEANRRRLEQLSSALNEAERSNLEAWVVTELCTRVLHGERPLRLAAPNFSN